MAAACNFNDDLFIQRSASDAIIYIRKLIILRLRQQYKEYTFSDEATYVESAVTNLDAKLMLYSI